MNTLSNRQIAVITVVAALSLLAWDGSGLDLPVAQWFGTQEGFPLRGNWLLSNVLHDGVKRIAWLLALGLCLGVWWPVGWLRSISQTRRLQLAITTLVSVFAVASLKTISTASCPWDLANFGGVAHYVPHWMHLLKPDGGSGGCFPAGHASTGFAFIGGYFAFRRDASPVARRWLIISLATGAALGLAQQMRGAHFTSHTLWTALICWCVAWSLDLLFSSLSSEASSSDLVEASR